MARKGRHRSKAARTRTGQLRRLQADRDVTLLVQQQPHRRWLPESQRRDQNAEDALGRQFMAGRLSGAREGETAALGRLWSGRRYQNLMREFLSVIAAPPGLRASGSAYVADDIGDHDRLAYLLRPDDDPERQDRLLREVNELSSVFASSEGMREQRRLLDRVCLQDLEPQPADRNILICALHNLAQWWRLYPERSRRAHAYITERPAWDDTTDIVRIEK